MEKSLIKIPLIILGIAILVSVFLNVYRPQSRDDTAIPTPVADTTTPSTNLCFYQSDKLTKGFYVDSAWLTMSITNDNKVTGEFHYLSAEKDSKVGTFEGIVETATASTISRLATVWWSATGEGVTNTEELLIAYDANAAKAGFGEMVQSDENTYVYKDKSILVYGPAMSKIDCDSLNEIVVVEKYIKDNIKTIATDKPVLGGTWMVTSVMVNPQAHYANAAYEDGHIKSSGHIEYTFTKNNGIVTITKFIHAD